MRSTLPRSVEPWPKMAKYVRTPWFRRPRTRPSERVSLARAGSLPSASAGPNPPASRTARARSRMSASRGVSILLFGTDWSIAAYSWRLGGKGRDERPADLGADDEDCQPHEQDRRSGGEEHAQVAIREDHRRAEVALDRGSEHHAED